LLYFVQFGCLTSVRQESCRCLCAFFVRRFTGYDYNTHSDYKVADGDRVTNTR
jgi:hypothetical protein